METGSHYPNLSPISFGYDEKLGSCHLRAKISNGHGSLPNLDKTPISCANVMSVKRVSGCFHILNATTPLKSAFTVLLEVENNYDCFEFNTLIYHKFTSNRFRKSRFVSSRNQIRQ